MITVPDNKIVCVWHCEDEDCMIQRRFFGHDRETATVNPDWYQNNGKPVCRNCDCDMVYSHTEVDCG